jgi:Na+/phosphate symporter
MTTPNISSSSSTPPETHKTMEDKIFNECMRQAIYGFNLAWAITASSACIGIFAATLVLNGKLPEATATAVSSLVSSACAIQLAKNSSDRLDKLLEELDD